MKWRVIADAFPNRLPSVARQMEAVERSGCAMHVEVANLQESATGVVSLLAIRHLIGRSRSCHLRLAHPEVSSVHAEIMWDGSVWRLRDLGSRNGTFVDGRRLAKTERAALERGAEIEFGAGGPRFSLRDDSAPRLMAIADNDQTVVALGRVLELPSEENSEACVFESAEGAWKLEDERGTRVVHDQELIVAGRQAWRLCLPAYDDATREHHRKGLPLLNEAKLHLYVSRDNDHVRIDVESAALHRTLEPRAHGALLLELARQRLDDAQHANLPPAEHGWIHREDVLSRLGLADLALLNVWVFRARAQLAAAISCPPSELIERRADANQMRLGVGSLVIERA